MCAAAPDLRLGGGLAVPRTEEEEEARGGNPAVQEPRGPAERKRSCRPAGSNLPLQLTLCSAIGGSLLFGTCTSFLNTAATAIAAEFGWCANGSASCPAALRKRAIASTAVFASAPFGALGGGSMLRAFGARRLLLLCHAVFVMGAISTVVATGLAAFLWGRIATGVAVGASSIASPALISQVAPPEKRGRYGVIHTLFITGGQFCIVLLGLPLPVEDGDNPPGLTTFHKIWWRVMVSIGTLVPVFIAAPLFLFRYQEDTPVHYAMQGDMDSAEAVLRKLRDEDNSSESDIQGELEALRKSVAAHKANAELGLTAAFRRHPRLLVVASVLAAFQQFVGINAFTASSNTLFESTGIARSVVTKLSAALTLTNFAMQLPAMLLIERWGRRLLLLVGCCGMVAATATGALALWVLGTDSSVASWIAAIGAVLFIIFFAGSYGPGLWVYLAEVFPEEVRGAGAGLATAICWICSTIVVLLAGFLNVRWSFTIFALLAAVAAVFVASCIRETKGRHIGAVYN